MPRTIIKWRLQTNKRNAFNKIKQELIITKSNLPPHLHSFKQKLL